MTKIERKKTIVTRSWIAFHRKAILVARFGGKCRTVLNIYIYIYINRGKNRLK